MKFSEMIKPEIDTILSLAHFTKDERTVFIYLTQGESIQYIALQMNLSIATVNRRIKSIKDKVRRV